jgi:hypothetical protein
MSTIKSALVAVAVIAGFAAPVAAQVDTGPPAPWHQQDPGQSSPE